MKNKRNEVVSKENRRKTKKKKDGVFKKQKH